MSSIQPKNSDRGCVPVHWAWPVRAVPRAGQFSGTRLGPSRSGRSGSGGQCAPTNTRKSMKYKNSQSSHNRGGFFCTNVGENSATDPDKHCHIVGGFFY